VSDSPSTHQDSPKVLKRKKPWPNVTLRRWSHMPPGYIPGYSVLLSHHKRPVKPGKREAETYLPVSALLFDEVVEAASQVLFNAVLVNTPLEARDDEINRKRTDEVARQRSAQVRQALQAVIEQVGGAE
jgi:hypothetical protein